MSDERKPVICPWCGWDMVAREGQDIFHGKYNVYVCDGCEAVSPIAYSEDAAYSAATATHPNLPLDYKTIYNLTDREPVWRVDKQDDVIVLGGYNAWRKYDAVRYLYFAANPSPADIEAARKGLDCK